MPFTEAQQQAIDHRDGHLQIIACAGSGKTQVLVERILGLLREGHPPSSIVAFTFTEKAAAELHDRVRQAIKQSGMAVQGTSREWYQCTSPQVLERPYRIA
jgi:DNA helicase-2/ATP-dependent DNA helicase PcrA